MARHLRVSVKWLRAEAEAGRVPHLKADKVLLFDPATVEGHEDIFMMAQELLPEAFSIVRTLR